MLIYQKRTGEFCYFAEKKISIENSLTNVAAGNIILYIIKLFN